MTSAVIELNDEQNGEYARDPDVRLMLRAKAGEEAAFAELVEKYQNRLVGIFYHLVSDQETAQDLAQEVFLRIYRARKGYVPTAKFSTWLFRIANNLASNSRRSSGRRREVTLNPSESGPLGARPQEQLLAEKSALMPTRQLDRREMREIVRTALDSLNERQRMAVLLHKFEEMSYADIGAAMEMSAAAVKSLLSRARENLRTKLEVYVKSGLLPDFGPEDEEPEPLK
jgi:RNA polymerase sigma-70 factor (ECF subfamily)